MKTTTRRPSGRLLALLGAAAALAHPAAAGPPFLTNGAATVGKMDGRCGNFPYHTDRPGQPQGSKNGTGFNVGAIYNISNIHHVMGSIGRNLTNADEINGLSVYVGYQTTF
ncbi:MAG TPA: hypothetical protein VE690_11000 [Rhodopila sp.]|nr:hypothetical protein [Rhodopila sp.]